LTPLVLSAGKGFDRFRYEMNSDFPVKMCQIKAGEVRKTAAICQLLQALIYF